MAQINIKKLLPFISVYVQRHYSQHCLCEQSLDIHHKGLCYVKGGVSWFMAVGRVYGQLLSFVQLLCFVVLKASQHKEFLALKGGKAGCM